MIFRVLDIETIPDLKVWTPNDSTYKWVAGQEGIDLEGGPKAPSPMLEEVPPFPPPHAQRVVAISYVDIAFDVAAKPKYRFDRCYTECLWSREESGLDAMEHQLLAAFAAAMTTPEVHFVTWNGRTFDLPVITLRSFKHRIPCAWYYNNKDVRYRYSTEGHCDLMDYLSDFGAMRAPMKLHDAARLWGLPGKTDMSGSQISDIYESTVKDPSLDLDKILARVAKYCLQDSIQTALMFLATRYHFGKVTLETYNTILDTFASSPSITDVIELDWNRLRL